MKNLLIFLLSTLIMVACQRQSEPAKEAPQIVGTPQDALIGVWKMSSEHSVSNLTGETVFTGADPVQYKIYLDGSVMWVRETDSADWFGYGTYSLNDSLRESYLAGSDAFRDAVGTGIDPIFVEISIGVDIKEDTYTQAIRGDSLTNYETYERVK